MHDMSDTKVSTEELQRWMNVMQQVFIEMITARRMFAECGVIEWESAKNEVARLRVLLDDARKCFVPDDMMTEEQIAIRDRVEFAVGAITRDPDADTGGDL
jgi:hypothetical protein